LVTRRTLYDHGTLVQAADSLAPLVPPNTLRLRPKAVEQLGVHEGDEVRVRGPRGALVLPVVSDPAVPEGVAVVNLAAAPVGEASAADLLEHAAAAVDVFVETIL
ncbi:MAG: molybdopterin dinucleotide binding domain-containing protein, partial [Acidimicrobiales bacterium]